MPDPIAGNCREVAGLRMYELPAGLAHKGVGVSAHTGDLVHSGERDSLHKRAEDSLHTGDSLHKSLLDSLHT